MKKSRPEVTLPNYEAVYDYYDHTTPTLVGKGLFAAIRLLYGRRVDAVFMNDTDRLHKSKPGGVGMLLAANYVSDLDTRMLVTALKQEHLGRVVGNTVTVAKSELFKNDVTGWVSRHVGALPIFRGKDLPRDSQGQVPSDVGELFGAATDRFVISARQHLLEGRNVLIFPQGTHQGDFKKGVGRVALGDPELAQDLKIVPMGIAYDAAQKNARIAIGSSLHAEDYVDEERGVPYYPHFLSDLTLQVEGCREWAQAWLNDIDPLQNM